MPKNDPAQDRYDPSSIGVTDFEPCRFGDLEVNELFWIKNIIGDNPAYRKINQNEALNTLSREIINSNQFNGNNIYQKI